MTTPDPAGFARACMDIWPDDIDGGTLQELGEKFGLLVPQVRHEFCNADDDECSTCMCREYCDAQDLRDGITCYRKQPLEQKP